MEFLNALTTCIVVCFHLACTNDRQYLLVTEQLRNVHRKLESALHSSKKRLAEVVDQCDALKKGREASVSVFLRSSLTPFELGSRILLGYSVYASLSSGFFQVDREEALAELKSIELKYTELKVRNMLHLF